MASKSPVKPAVSGKSERPRYRVSPQARFEHQTEVRIREKFQGVAEADVSRQHAGSDGHSTLDQALVVFPFEMTYPGGRDHLEAAISRKWIYAFDVKSRRCILEGRALQAKLTEEQLRESSVWSFARIMNNLRGDATVWKYRAGVLKPASFDGDAPLKESSVAGLPIPPDLVTDQTGLAFFLSPHRLSQRAIEFLIDKLKVRKSDPDFPFAMVWWNDTTVGHVTLCDPYRWAAEAAQKYYVREVEQWQEFAHKPEVNARLFIAKVVKAWRDAEIAKVDDKIIRKGLAESKIERINTELQQRHEEAEKAAVYTIQCVESPEHRAVEMAAQDFGGKALVDTLANYALVLQGMGMTGPGVMWINTLCEDRERVPWQYVMSDAPPSNCPNYASDSKAYYPATVIVSVLGPAQVRDQMAARLASGASAQEASGAALGMLRARLERIYAGRATFSMKEEKTAAYVASEPMWKAGTDPSAPRTKRRVEVTCAQLGYEYGDSYSDAEVLDPKSDLMAEIHKWGTSSAALFGTGAEVFNPLGPVVSLTNLATSALAWQSKVSKDETVAVGWFDVQADTLGLMSAVSGMGSSLIEIANLKENMVDDTTKKVIRRRLFGAAGVLAIASAVFEVAGSNKKAMDAIVGKRNYMEGVGHLMVSAGSGVLAVGGGLSLGAAIFGTFAATGPVGFILGVVGTAVAFVGGLVAAEFATTPLSEFVKFSFLGTEGDSTPRQVEVSWTGERLPIGGPVEQAALLLYLLGSFTMRRAGSEKPDSTGAHDYPRYHRTGYWRLVGSHKQLRVPRDRDCEPLVHIDLGYFPVGSRLDLEIIQRYPNSPMKPSGLYRPRGLVSFAHETPGQIVELEQPALSEIRFANAEYLVDDSAIRAFRMELRPVSFGLISRATTVQNNTMRDWRSYCTGCLVKARISIGGQPMLLKSMPQAAGWVGIHMFASDVSPVSSLNPGSYIDSNVVS